MKTTSTIIYTLAGELTPKQRMTAYLEMVMRLRGISAAAVAKKHRLSRYYVSASITGKKKMGPRVQAALEADLGVSLGEFVTEIQKGT